jgi:hypothetical protein
MQLNGKVANKKNASTWASTWYCPTVGEKSQDEKNSIPNNRPSLCHVNPGPPTFGETSQDTKNLIPNIRSSWCH